MKVDFVLIGAQKSGTTSLAAQLADHPQICFSRVKEPGFFNETEDWQSEVPTYHKLFDAEPGQLCGEASTMYTFLPEYTETHRRLHAYNSTLKLIYIMRQPVNRAISHYTHNLVRNLEKKPPEDAVFSDPRYINRSRYAVQIRPYIELFGFDNILLLLFEEYIAAQAETLRTVANFLGIAIDGFSRLDDSAKHQSVGQPYLKSQLIEKWVGSEFFDTVRTIVPASIRRPIRYRFFSNQLDELPQFPLKLKRLMWQLLVDDVTAVEKLMGRPLDDWRNWIDL